MQNTLLILNYLLILSIMCIGLLYFLINERITSINTSYRAGRCGRAGRQGLVINFATPETKFVIRRFGKQLGVKILDCEIRDAAIFLKQR